MSLTGVWYCFNLKTRLPTPTSIPSPLPLLAEVIASWNTQPKIVFLQVWPYDSVVTHMTQFESVSDKLPTPLWGHDCPKCHHWFCSGDEAWEVIYRIHLTGIFRRGWDLQLQRKFPKNGESDGWGNEDLYQIRFPEADAELESEVPDTYWSARRGKGRGRKHEPPAMQAPGEGAGSTNSASPSQLKVPQEALRSCEAGRRPAD